MLIKEDRPLLDRGITVRVTRKMLAALQTESIMNFESLSETVRRILERWEEGRDLTGGE